MTVKHSKMETKNRFCRICFSGRVSKNLHELPKILDVNQKYRDLMFYCLDIKIPKTLKHSTKLCIKCVDKLKSYSEFKTLAQKNDSHLRSLQDSVISLNDCDVKKEEKVETYVDNGDIKVEKVDTFDCNDYDDDTGVHEVEIKTEQALPVDEFLTSETNNIKYEYMEPALKKIITEDARSRRRRYKQTYRNKQKLKKVEKVACTVCNKLVKNLKNHMVLHNPDLKRSWPCDQCPKVFESIGGRSRHIKRIHDGILEMCTICNKGFSSLRVHQKTVHYIEELPYECLICNKRFLYPAKLDIHMVQHSEERKFECDHCKKTFATKLNIEHHIRRMHLKERSLLCQYCSKTFYKPVNLQRHLRSHTKEKPYKCETCGKYYSCGTSLRTHMSLHTGTKNFKCNICDQTFANKSYLRGHMKNHLEKQHACKYCGIKFKRTDHRNRHQFTAHEKGTAQKIEAPSYFI